jgi:chitinase
MIYLLLWTEIYPLQEPDILGIPADDPNDGQNYLAFLRVLRGTMPDKSISIAAPSSYWYLKGFPIAEIAQTVDYIVYMTYDLHGQVRIPFLC